MCKNIQQAKDMTKIKMIRIGYPSTYDASTDYDKLKRLIDDYAAHHPEIDLNEILYDFMDLKHALLYGDVDLIFAQDFVFNNAPHISIKKVCRSRLCLAMSAKHPLASVDSIDEIDRADLEKEVFYAITIDDELIDRERNIARLNAYGIVPKDIQYVLNFQSLMRTVRQGKGMTICGYFPNASGHEDIKFIELPVGKFTPYLVLSWRTNDISKEAKGLIDMIPDDPDGLSVFEQHDNDR